MPERDGSRLVRPDVLQMPSVPHGSVAASELADLGLSPAHVLAVSVNTNSIGSAPSVLGAVQTADWTPYPSDDEQPPRRALARRAGLEVDQVAQAFRRALLPLGLVVRDCASFGLPACVRIACRRPEERQRLLAAIARVKAGVARG